MPYCAIARYCAKGVRALDILELAGLSCLSYRAIVRPDPLAILFVLCVYKPQRVTLALLIQRDTVAFATMLPLDSRAA